MSPLAITPSGGLTYIKSGQYEADRPELARCAPRCCHARQAVPGEPVEYLVRVADVQPAPLVADGLLEAGGGIVVGPGGVSLAHVMHDVSGGGRIGVPSWRGEPETARWFPLGDLPTDMLDRARVALRHYADGLRFSTYPAFVPPAHLAC